MGSLLMRAGRGVYQTISPDKESAMSDDQKDLPPAAQSALAEAEERRKKAKLD